MNNETYSVYGVKVEVGLKIEVDAFTMNDIKRHPYIQENFKLNIVRVDDFTWSICFAEKCDHSYELLIFGEDEFCSNCGIKITSN